MNELLDVLREFDALRDGDAGNDVVHQRSLSAIAPTYADVSVFDGLAPPTAEALRRCGIDRLYQHQADAISHARDGSNVVLQAPTASGKTLAFQIPMLQSLRTLGTHALMIYPTKALALDQRDQLMRLTEQMGDPRIESWWYDGDVDTEQRRVLRETPPSILITNPDMLHKSFLGHADRWSLLYRGLTWVIVDEMHEYRGYFGSNVAMILRRFSHHLAARGVRPQFFLSSATCANAREHAENLTGRPFVEVNATNGMRPHRQFTFVQPDIPDFQYWEILQLRVVKAGLACLSKAKSVLAFCPTRKFAEACHFVAMRELEKLDDEGRHSIDAEAIKVFRSGLSVDERHAVQAGLKSGAVRLVFTTNALELGIDIGGLDGIILAGFPDSMMSAWQRIGRAGRSWDTNAFVLLLRAEQPTRPVLRREPRRLSAEAARRSGRQPRERGPNRKAPAVAPVRDAACGRRRRVSGFRHERSCPEEAAPRSAAGVLRRVAAALLVEHPRWRFRHVHPEGRQQRDWDAVRTTAVSRGVRTCDLHARRTHVPRQGDFVDRKRR